MTPTQQNFIAILDEAIGLAPGTRNDHVERVRALNQLVTALSSTQKRVQELEAQLEPTPEAAEAA